MSIANFPLAPRTRTMAVLLVVALAVGMAGYWGPWVAHEAVSLILIGQDMGEFVKFLPEVRSGEVTMVRELFYLPPFSACWVLALLAAGRAVRYHAAARVVFLLAIVPVSLALLPPVFSVPVLKSAEFRLQVIGVVVCLALIPGWLLLRRLPAWVQAGLIALFGLLGAVPALWQFWVVLPAVQRVYHAPVRLGWGMAAVALGYGMLALLGALLAVQLLRENKSKKRKVQEPVHER